MDTWTRDPPEPNTAYRFRYYVHDGDSPTGKQLVDTGRTFLARGDWLEARKRLRIERLTKGERVDLSNYPLTRYLELDVIPSA